MKQSNYTYRVHCAQCVVFPHEYASIAVQVRRHGVWVDVKTYRVLAADRDALDYAMLCAVELRDNLQADQRI